MVSFSSAVCLGRSFAYSVTRLFLDYIDKYKAGRRYGQMLCCYSCASGLVGIWLVSVSSLWREDSWSWTIHSLPYQADALTGIALLGIGPTTKQTAIQELELRSSYYVVY